MRCTTYHFETSRVGWETSASSTEILSAELIRQPVCNSMRLGESADPKVRAATMKTKHIKTASCRFMEKIVRRDAQLFLVSGQSVCILTNTYFYFRFEGLSRSETSLNAGMICCDLSGSHKNPTWREMREHRHVNSG